jgi:hypothetical protein
LVSAAGILALSLIAPAWTVQAQTPTTPPPPAPPRDPAAAAARRDDLKMIEGVLTNAVKNGADNLGRQMQINQPGSLIVTGTARARGFVLDGYGAFFIVDVPMMKQSVIWSTQVLLQQQRRDFLRQFIATNPDGPARRQAELMLRNLERTQGQTATPAPVAQPAPGIAAAATVPDAAPPAHEAAPAAHEAAPAAHDAASASVPPSFDRDPNELYTEAVKSALMDAMVRYGWQLRIGPDEWLTVAAQDAEGPLPGQIYDASTIVLRVKGSDLAAYQANRLTRDEVIKKVEVREF